MYHLSHSFLLVYAALFPIINPVGSAPIFLDLTQFCTAAQRTELARRVAFSSFLLLLGSLLVGSHVLGFFGISLPAVRIGGGLVVTALGWKLLNAEPSADRDHAASGPGSTIPDFLLSPDHAAHRRSGVDVCGHRPRRPAAKGAGLEQLLLPAAGALAGLVALAGTVYLSYRFAQSLTSLLGRTGASVLIRLSAFILVCIGIQIIWEGLRQLGAAIH